MCVEGGFSQIQSQIWLAFIEEPDIHIHVWLHLTLASDDGKFQPCSCIAEVALEMVVTFF